MSLVIRPGTSRDVADVDALLAASYPVLLKPDYPPSVMVTALPLISRAQPALITCGTYFVVEQEGILRAAGGWTFGPPKGTRPAPGLGHVRHVVTDHRAVRRGFGRALMDHILADAGARGATRLEALSTLTAVPFYRAMGFAPLGEVDVPLGPAGLPFRAVRMDRSL
ncbi:GNAT family N-acetyltransferase [Tropicimonas sp. S265A]|uniref:GNAT family N-acetyltransferase n=1 Tax=Tropicimonas sp. S265A TaxID=3415134 RepID=UPI003C7B99CF